MSDMKLGNTFGDSKPVDVVFVPKTNPYLFKSVIVDERLDERTQAIEKKVKWTFESVGKQGFDKTGPIQETVTSTITIKKPTQWQTIVRAIADWLDAVVGIKHLPIDPRCLDMKVNDVIRFPHTDKDRILYDLGLESDTVARTTKDDDTVFTVVSPKEATFVMRPELDNMGRATQFTLKRVY
jgi:hypothetical protein